MREEERLTREQLSAWKPLAAVLELLPASLNSSLQKSTGQPLVNLLALGHLQQKPNKTTGLSDIAACVSTPLPRASRIVARLEADGLVERSTCETDGRAVIITLTTRGEQVLAEAMPHHDRLIRDTLIDVLSPTQLEQLRDIATTLEAHLHPDMASPVDRQRQLDTL
ncbi:MarR family winged helix-turn-helix transcriptional regulator [Frondihabitans cladoniiphilus]|uniref:HTH marR-type domain-containing protein n=1 Tax=Frondihabitans cladoniiphilus TaxID=715785 RepID=A0ABP8VV27_9MICO